MRHLPKVLVVGIGGGTFPSNNFTTCIDQPAQLDTDYPASVGQALLAKLPFATPFADWMQQSTP